MSTPVRIVGFVAGLTLVGLAAFGIGRMVGGDEEKDASYAMRLSWGNGSNGLTRVSFQIARDGEVVTSFAPRHEKDMHLVAVSSDFTRFRHVHPTMSDAGTWSTEVDLGAGPWRLYADFQPRGGKATVTSQSLVLEGQHTPGVLPEPSRTAKTGDYTVSLDGDLAAGADGTLGFTVTRKGEPVTDLEPYLGAYGHLVVIRADDMRYLHVHPEDGPAGPRIAFGAEVPSSGTYHLYLDFQHAGKVRNVSFQLDAGTAPEADHASDNGEGHDGDH